MALMLPENVKIQDFDTAFPTVVRYIGILLIVFYAIGTALGTTIPESVLIAATGMILFKTVKGKSDDEA